MSYDQVDRKQAAKKLLLEQDFLTFTRWTFKQNTGQTFSVSEHHRILADALQRVLDGKLKRLKIHIPPRYSKTEFVKSFCACGFARNPESQFIYTSYSDTLALKCSKEIRDLITNDKFQNMWQIDIRTDTKSKKLWETTAGGGMYAVSTGGPVTGFGAGKNKSYKTKTAYSFNGAIIIDDPIKVQDRHSKPARDASTDYYDSTLRSRLNGDSETPIVLIMQRVHKEDLAGWIDENEGEDWETISLPAIKEGIVAQDGTPLWPEKHTIEELIKMSKNNEMFLAQYMQQPIAIGGNIIRPEEFGRYREIPFLRKRFVTADTALKDKEHNDYTVFQCWGIGHDNKMYLIDNLRIKIKSKDLKQRFKDFWNKNNNLDPRQYGYLTCAYIEDKASGTQLIQELEAESRIPVKAIPRNRSKLERVLDILLPRMYMVMIPEDAPWISDFFRECEEFTAEMSHKHDDQIDPMVDAVEIGLETFVHNSGIVSSNMKRHSSKRSKRVRRR